MRASAPFVAAFGVFLLFWLVGVRPPAEFIGFIGMVAATGAAIFAAVSAAANRESAGAAREAVVATRATVDEMRRSREQERQPLITLEKGFDYFSVSWPIITDSAGPTFERYVRDPFGTERGLPQIAISNFGGGPALDLTIEFSLQDGDEPLEIPRHYQQVPYGGHGRIAVHGSGLITFSGVGASLMGALSRTAIAAIPHCGPGQTRRIDIPRGVLFRCFVRALQSAPRVPFLQRPPDLDLSLVVRFKTVHGSIHEEGFGLRLRPAVSPNATNGPPSVIWEDHEEVLRASFDGVDLPRDHPAVVTAEV